MSEINLIKLSSSGEILYIFSPNDMESVSAGDYGPPENIIEVPTFIPLSTLLTKYIYYEGEWLERPERPIKGVYEWDLISWSWVWNQQQNKQHIKDTIDSHAESTRLRFITPGAGQAMEYQESYAQARVKKANPSAVVPMVAADRKAGMKNPLTQQPIQSDDEAADVIIFMYEQWLLVGAAIREIRLKAKVDIDAATTPEEVESIFEAAKAQLDAL